MITEAFSGGIRAGWWRLLKIILLASAVTLLLNLIFAFYGIAHKESGNSIIRTLFYTAFLTEGVQLINRLMDRSTGWHKNPVKRFILQFSLNLGFILFFSIGIKSIIFYYLIHVSAAQMMKAQLAINVTTIVIAFLVVSIDLGIFLLKRWAYSLSELEVSKRENLQFHYEVLISQINPHFLFNSLNTLSALIYTNQSQAAEFTLYLSAIFRNVLEAKVREVVTIEEELVLAASYIKLMRIRFTESLFIEIEQDTIPMTSLIPCMTIQLLLENAVNHNEVSDASPLRLRLYTEDNYLIVENNLQEKDFPLHSTGIGLKNIAERYKMIGNHEIEINKTSDRFIVRLPLIASI